jgi:hypothetical protein
MTEEGIKLVILSPKMFGKHCKVSLEIQKSVEHVQGCRLPGIAQGGWRDLWPLIKVARRDCDRFPS